MSGKIINFEEATKPSKLEKEYIEHYGEEFVNDLKQSYLKMRRDMNKQPPREIVLERRRHMEHVFGEWRKVFYVDFRHEYLYSQIIDSNGGKTIRCCGNSPRLKTDTDQNIRYLLSGMFFYDKNKTRKWLDTLLGQNERFWYEGI